MYLLIIMTVKQWFINSTLPGIISLPVVREMMWLTTRSFFSKYDTKAFDDKLLLTNIAEILLLELGFIIISLLFYIKSEVIV